jgi:pimeloyl-ACP methyl ester carboxylesterase
MKKIIKILPLILMVTACSSHPIEERMNLAQELANKVGFAKRTIKTKSFFLTTYSKFETTSNSKSVINVYIEGDGYAWVDRYKLSKDPTPINPISLRLAAVDQRPNVLYIARPCQYVDRRLEKGCSNIYWSGSRFAPEVVDSLNQVIDYFKKKHGISHVRLYGHSGGGALAVIVAGNRKDVYEIGTAAANLNHKELNKIHEVTPMSSSLDAIDFVEKVRNIPQFHLVGKEDQVVLPEIITDFVKKVNAKGGMAEFEIIKDAGHEYPLWPKVWKGYIKD